MNMEWRVVPGFEAYEISEFGEARRAMSGSNTYVGKYLKMQRGTKGYIKYKLSNGAGGRQSTVSAHVAVALAFIGPCPPDKSQVAHNDGNNRNNHFSNLRRATQAENMDDRRNHNKVKLGSNHHSSKLTNNDV